MTDALQILLNQSGAWKFFSCALIFSCGWLVWRYFFALFGLTIKIWREIKKPFIPVSIWSVVFICIGGGLTSLFSVQLSDGLEWFEQKYLDPVYVSNDTSSFAVKCYESELSKNLSSEQMQTLVTWTDRIAKDCGSTRLAFYEVYNSECGLNPFAVNTRFRNGRVDTIAAGILQFTSAGIEGLSTMREVKDAVIRKDLEFLMELSYRYMERASQGKSLERATDVYTAVFMPKFVGCSDQTVLASLNSSRPDYYLENICLDGHYLDNQKIMTSPKARDGKITIYDLYLHLELKKSQILKRYADK